MSLGPIMVGVAGVELTPQEREMLQHPLVGAVILFARNFHDYAQLRRLIDAIHGLRQPRLLVAVDHEGGRVQRFRDGFTELPAVRCFGQIYDEEPKRARRLAESAGWLMAAELRAAGVDFSFAPVLDLDYGVSEVIGDRAFHRQPHAVADIASRYIAGMRKAGMAATGKHFPGHGAVEVDTHLGMARDERSLADIEQADMVPFRRLIGEGLAGIMPAHVIYPRVDAQPAGFSRFWLEEVLRRRLGFQGVIFSDDLLMAGAAVAGSVADRAEQALAAGCDMVLVCDDFDAICSAIDRLARFDKPVTHLRLARMHGRLHFERERLHNDPRWKNAVEAIGQCEQVKARDLL